MGAAQGRSEEEEGGTGTQRLQFSVGDPQDVEPSEEKEDEVIVRGLPIQRSSHINCMRNLKCECRLLLRVKRR